MTDATAKAAIEAAIRELGDYGDAIVIGWVVCAALKRPTDDGDTRYYGDCMDGQPYHSTIGLLAHALDTWQKGNPHADG